MKVNIGPYPSRWSSRIHSKWIEWHHKVDYSWNVDEDQYDKWDRAVEWLENRLQELYNATINKYLDKRQRKIEIVVDNYDTWAADHTLALIIHPLLLKLKSVQHGSGQVDDDDVPENLRSSAAPAKENEWDTDANLHKRWAWVFDEMIWAFDAVIKSDDADPFMKFVDDSEAQFGIRVVKNDIEGRKAHNARIENGLRLFGKYFRSLWD